MNKNQPLTNRERQELENYRKRKSSRQSKDQPTFFGLFLSLLFTACFFLVAYSIIRAEKDKLGSYAQINLAEKLYASFYAVLGCFGFLVSGLMVKEYLTYKLRNQNNNNNYG